MAVVDVSDLVVGIIMLVVGCALGYFANMASPNRAIKIAMSMAAIVLVVVGLIFIILAFVAPGVI